MRRKEKPVTAEDIENVAATMKVVVLFEVRPLSDEFEQIMLTAKQAKAVRDAIWRTAPVCKDCGGHQITTTDDHGATFKDIRTSFPEKEIAAASCPI